MRLMVLSAVFAMIANAAVAGDWRLTTYNDRGAAIIDVSSIRQVAPNKWVAWTALVWSRTNERGSDYHIKRDEFDCRDQSVTNIAFVSYRPDGTTLVNENERQEPNYVIPGSMGEATFEVVCGSDPQYGEESWPNVRAFMEDFRSPDL